ncbi:MAG TPA: hypothetical protein DCF72_11295 [Gammaproteobacteria bacterium]|nr:hypothetical protein [Gammaproteobacteria bacterium]
MITRVERISCDQITFAGQGLVRPECVIATCKGDLYASHAGGGITHIAPTGGARVYLANNCEKPADFLPNGYSLRPDGSFLIANLGQSGGVYVLDRDGSLQVFVSEVDGLTLPATNFANLDREGRTWISVSTSAIDREQSFNKTVADGFIALVDRSGARVVADGIGFTNENKVDPSGHWLYVHETMGRSLLRFPIRANGDLGPRQTVTEYGPGVYPDGFEFDSEGGIWCASVLSNRIIRLDPDGVQQMIIDAGDPDLVERAESAYQSNTFSRSLISEGLYSPLGNCASLCFGGDDLKTVFVGSLHLDRIASFRSPVAGAPPPHWLF